MSGDADNFLPLMSKIKKITCNPANSYVDLDIVNVNPFMLLVLYHIRAKKNKDDMISLGKVPFLEHQNQNQRVFASVVKTDQSLSDNPCISSSSPPIALQNDIATCT